ncbi:hypothetical protein ACVIGB_007182 [Bradyrhizobium sp. USDA 4341]
MPSKADIDDAYVNVRQKLTQIRPVLRYEQQSCSNYQIVSREYYPSATNTYLLPSLASVPTFGINQ